MMHRKKITLFNKEIFLTAYIRDKRTRIVCGVGNRTTDGKYLLFLDYDNMKIQWIVDEIESLQKKHNLGTFYFFKSGETGHHAICLDKLPYKKFLTVLDETSTDINHKMVPRKYGKKIWVLRFTRKQLIPQYIGELYGSSKRERSKAHRIYLEKVFKLKIPAKREDKYTRLIMARYNV